MSYLEDLKHGIKLIGQLPCIPEWYLPDSRQTEQMIEKFHKGYQCIEKWLNHLLLHEPEPNTEEDPELLGYYFSALHLQRLYELIRAARHWLNFSQLDCIEHWVRCIYSDCEWRLAQSGLKSAIEDGVAKPQITGKTDFIQHQSRATQKYKTFIPEGISLDSAETVRFITISKEQAKEATYFHLRGLTEGKIYKLAQQNKVFRNTHWLPYLHSIEVANDVFRKSENFQLSYLLPNGTILVTKKHGKLPKGFDSDIRKAQREAKQKKMALQL